LSQRVLHDVIQKKKTLIIFFLVATSLVVYGTWFIGGWELLLLALLALANKLCSLVELICLEM